MSISLGFALGWVLEKLYTCENVSDEIGVVSDLVWRKLVVVFASF